MSSGAAQAEPVAAPLRTRGPSVWDRYRTPILFLIPAAILLGVWIVYPTIYTIVRSFYDRSGSNFIGFDNYNELFSQDNLTRAIRNNVLWLAIVPAFVTAIGLIFAVLLERVRWSVAFKTIVFMPMAISLFAAGVIWRVMYEKDPDVGAVNAALNVAADKVDPPGALSQAQPSSQALKGSASQGLTLQKPVEPGDSAKLGLTGIPPTDVPKEAQQARAPPTAAGAISGVVWRDFKPGGGKPGVIERGELGLPGVTVELKEPGGGQIATAKTQDDGTFVFKSVKASQAQLAIGADTFEPPFDGVSWLGSKLIVPSIMLAYIWVWAGFSMVVIGAGLAAIPRDLLEAARTDGATEGQVFRRVTVPLLRPVLVVVFVTMLINVLKIFDIVLSVAPASSQDEANVIALAMWRTSFGGVNDFGLGSAIAVFLFLLVIPILLLNIRNFRREA